MISFSAEVALVITIIFVIGGFLLQKSKLLFYIQGIWMWLMVGWNTYSVDWNSNYPIFVLAQKKLTLKQNLYENLCSIFKSLNFDFMQFNALISLFSISLIAYSIKRESLRPALQMSLIFIYPFVDFVVQKRFFLAFALVFWILPKAHSEELKEKIGYVIVVLLAGWIHNSMYIYLLIFLVDIIPKKVLYRSIIIIIIIASMSRWIVYRVASLLPFISESKFELYFIIYANNSSLLKYLFWIGLHITYYIIIHYMNHYFHKKYRMDKINDSLLCDNIFSLFLLPFYSFDPVFFRLFRPIIIKNNIHLFNLLSLSKKQSKIVLLACIYQILVLIGTFIIMYIITSDFDAMVIQIFENNAFIELFFR